MPLIPADLHLESDPEWSWVFPSGDRAAGTGFRLIGGAGEALDRSSSSWRALGLSEAAVAVRSSERDFLESTSFDPGRRISLQPERGEHLPWVTWVLDLGESNRLGTISPADLGVRLALATERGQRSAGVVMGDGRLRDGRRFGILLLVGPEKHIDAIVEDGPR